MSQWQAIAQSIGVAQGHEFQINKKESIGGGCIDPAWKVSNGAESYFVKTSHQGNAHSMFQAEAEGLKEMKAADMNTPGVIATGKENGFSWLVLEYLPMQSASKKAQEKLGNNLARMHRHCAAEHGWHINNRIGSTPQSNRQHKNWLDFYREERLLPQLKMLERSTPELSLMKHATPLLENLGELFSGYRPKPSLLHGDLWSGNHAMTDNEQPVIFDPACYYGDRETDIAMTELFGGFSPAFYEAYQAEWPLDPGYSRRKTLYNLYHILNHANIFGGGYGMQARRMIDELNGRV